MLDTLQIVFWSITYILIIVAGFKSADIKKVSMPYIAVAQNFSWEFVALVNSRHWAHVVWFSLDLMIVAFCFLFLKNNRQRWAYALGIGATVMMLFVVFEIPSGMLISCFIIDLIMAISFLIKRKQLSSSLKVPIAITRLVGDAFAGLHYSPQSIVVAVIACAVLVCNCLYLCLCWHENDVQG